MFGTNKVTKPFLREDGALLVNDIFYTIQGEGPDAGCPAIFVRLAKCNLRCYFCDTEFESGTERSLEDLDRVIGKMVMENKCNLVVITGGEPLLQNIIPLVTLCNNNGVRVSIESAGSIYLPDLAMHFQPKPQFSIHGNMLIVSPKTGSINMSTAACAAAFKYIVNMGDVSEEDGLPIRSTQKQGAYMQLFRPWEFQVPIYVQAMDVGDDGKNHANLLLASSLAMKHGYRLSVQVHKLCQLP